MINVSLKRIMSIALSFMLVASILSLPSNIQKVNAEVIAANDGEYEDVENRVSGESNGSYFFVQDGMLNVWGSNQNSVLGIRNNNAANNVRTTAYRFSTELFSGEKVLQVSSSETHTLVLTTGGVYGWGNNQTRQANPEMNLVLVQISSTLSVKDTKFNSSFFDGKRVARVFAGYSHSAVLAEDGTIYQWGENADGQCGTGTVGSIVTRPSKVDLPTIKGKKFLDVRCLLGTTIALDSQGTLYAWGSNVNGLCGINTTNNFVNDAARVSNISKPIKQFDVGLKHVVAMSNTGEVYTWGSNEYGQLGIGNTTMQKVPVMVSAFSGVTKRVFTGYYNTIAINAKNQMYVCGMNSIDNNFALDPKNRANILTPVKMSITSYYNLSRMEITTNETIVYVGYQQNSGLYILTNTGNMYFRGCNDRGAMCNGTTNYLDIEDVYRIRDGETGDSGLAAIRSSDGLAQTKWPYPTPINSFMSESKTAGIFEIKIKDKHNNIFSYSVDANGNPNSDITLVAGQTYRAIVSFKEFARLNAFEIPIRFDPDYIRVKTPNYSASYLINKAECETVTFADNPLNDPPGYSSTNRYTPIKNLIDKNVKWQGGDLVVNGTYPKISNRYGYVSVSGYAPEPGAAPYIAKEADIFGFDFVAIQENYSGDLGFQIATGENYCGDAPILDNHYAYDVFAKDARWLRIRDGETEPSDINSFKAMVSPKFKIKSIPIGALTVVPEVDGQTPRYDSEEKAYILDRGNQNPVKMIAKPDKDDASGMDFIKWKWDFKSLTIDPPTVWEDHIEILNGDGRGTNTSIGATGLFKIKPQFAHQTVYYEITATTGKITASCMIKIVNIKPPSKVEIAEKKTNPFIAKNDYLLMESVDDGMILTPNFPAPDDYFSEDGIPYYPESPEVAWSVYQYKNDRVIDITNTSSNPFEMTIIPVTAKKTSNLKIRPKRHIRAEEEIYVKLRSYWRDEVYDTLRVKTDLKILQIKANPTYLIAKPNTTINLYPSIISIRPTDADPSDLRYKVSDDDMNDPFVLSCNEITGDIKLSNRTIRKEDFESNMAGQPYAEITVSTTRNPAAVAKVKIYVLAISPATLVYSYQNLAGPNDTKRENRDTVTLTRPVRPGGAYAGYELKAGDMVKIYRRYTDDKPCSFTTISESDVKDENGKYKPYTVGNFQVEYPILGPDGQPTSGREIVCGLDPNGNYIGIQVISLDPSGDTDINGLKYKVYDKDIFHVGRELGCISGYVKLTGKHPLLYGGVEVTAMKGDMAIPGAKTITNSDGSFEIECYEPATEMQLYFKKQNYLTRTVDIPSSYVPINNSNNFTISRNGSATPVILNPGAILDRNGEKITIYDINFFLTNWYGKTSKEWCNGPEDEKKHDMFNFYQMDRMDDSIELQDFALIIEYLGNETRTSYPRYPLP